MYKEIKNKIKKNEDQISYSEEEVVNIIANMLLKKSQDYKNVDIEDLRKNWKKAFANGLTVLGMLHGAHYMADATGPKSEREKSPTYQRIQQEIQAKQAKRGLAATSPIDSKADPVKQAYEDARAEGQAIIDKHQQRDKNIDNFLKAISMNESSGGKNTNHKEMKTGIHAGDAAVGQYGLMPNTIKEMANRMDENHPMRQYAKMDSDAIGKSIKQNPDHENQIANFMANHLYDKFGGDENKMSYSWFQGHNLTNDHFDTSHKDYMNHEYVKKYQKHKGILNQK